MPRRARFNGAALYRARNWGIVVYKLAKFCQLQRGHAPSSAESRSTELLSGRRHHASTGPRSLERGINGCGPKNICDALLQRDRALSSAESSTAKLRMITFWLLQRGRLCRGGNRPSERRKNSRHCCFNGAALRRTRNHLAPIPDAEKIVASTGPHSVERGIAARNPHRGSRSSCFNGPALYRARQRYEIDGFMVSQAPLQRDRAL